MRYSKAFTGHQGVATVSCAASTHGFRPVARLNIEVLSSLPDFEVSWGVGLVLTQTPGRIQKVDPLIWYPILLRVLYRNPH